jgi:hypothetical protein
MLNEHLTAAPSGRAALCLADLIDLDAARMLSGKAFTDWEPSCSVFISVDTLTRRYADMTTAERIDECNGEHIMGWFEEQGDDEADEDGDFMSTPGHYWPNHPTEGAFYATIGAVEAPSVEDYRDALEHCARGGVLSIG